MSFFDPTSSEPPTTDRVTIRPELLVDLPGSYSIEYREAVAKTGQPPTAPWKWSAIGSGFPTEEQVHRAVVDWFGSGRSAMISLVVTDQVYTVSATTVVSAEEPIAELVIRCCELLRTAEQRLVTPDPRWPKTTKIVFRVHRSLEKN